jgi:hypothetical protein
MRKHFAQCRVPVELLSEHFSLDWFVESAMDVLLEENFAVADKDRLYRCLDRVLEHKQELFVWLKQTWAELFQADFEVLL